MKHWSVDTSELEKDPQAFAKWRLEQGINFGIRDGKLDERELRRFWNVIDIDPHKRAFLSLLLAS